jgi:hypothetical protein
LPKLKDFPDKEVDLGIKATGQAVMTLFVVIREDHMYEWEEEERQVDHKVDEEELLGLNKLVVDKLLNSVLKIEFNVVLHHHLSEEHLTIEVFWSSPSHSSHFFIKNQPLEVHVTVLNSHCLTLLVFQCIDIDQSCNDLILKRVVVIKLIKGFVLTFQIRFNWQLGIEHEHFQIAELLTLIDVFISFEILKNVRHILVEIWFHQHHTHDLDDKLFIVFIIQLHDLLQ